MAVLRRTNFLSGQRVDVPDMRALESAASNDFDQLIQAFVTGTTQGYFLRGFNILMTGAIGGAASGLQLNVDPGAILHIASSQSGTILMVPTGTAPQQLNSAINPIVDGAFAPNAINYVSIEYERFLDPTTSAQVYIWDPTSNTETTKNAPRAVILRYRIKITTATPLTNYLPVARVVTDSGNNVTSISDIRWDLFRLGTGGPTADPSNTYSWPQGRSENPSTSTSNSVDPFSGGDKAISNLKEWMNAVMSSILEIKGTTYWYSGSSAGSLESLKEDLGNTVVTGAGSISHGVSPVDKITPTAPGQINWDQPINLRVVGSALTYSLSANATSTDITLADDQVAYVTLVRGVSVSPNLIFTNGIAQVTSVGAVAWTGLLQSNDYIKLYSDTDAAYYKILSVDSASQITLTTTFAGTSTGAGGSKAKYAFGTYNAAVTPSTSRDIFISSRESVPEGADVFWLFMRTDNGGAPRVYVRFLGTELDDGEDINVDGTTSAEVLRYIGGSSITAATSAPLYVVQVSPGAVPQITNIAVGAASTMSANQYFYVNSSGNHRVCVVWVKKDGVGTQPVLPFIDTYLEWDVTTGQTSTQTATALASTLNNEANNDFSAVSGVGTVTVTNTSAGTSVAASNGDISSPFAITIGQSGTGIGNFAIKDKDNLTLAIKELDQALANIALSLDQPNYDEMVSIVASGATPPNSLNGPISATTVISLPNNSRLSNAVQFYTVGKGTLQVFLNGQFLGLNEDYSEVGTAGTPSNSIEILRVLDVLDQLEFRLSGGGGGAGGGGGEGPPGPAGPSGPPGADALNGPINISTKSTNYTVLLTDGFLLANCASGAITLTLPTAASAASKAFYFKKKDSTANAMTIMANGSELIDGLNTISTTVQYEAFSLVSDGAQWWFF